MNDIIDHLSLPWVPRALFTASLVGMMCGILGCFIVLRNMSLIGDALSHAVLPGIFVAFLLVGYSSLGFFIGASIAGLISALAISLIQQYVTTKNDAAIGIIFTTMFAIGVIGITWLESHGSVHLDLDHFLFGNVIGIGSEDIYLTVIIAIYTVISVSLFYRQLFITTFQPTIAETMGISTKYIHYFLMLLLSFSIVVSLRAVGVILVVAMLITPASTALLLSNKFKHVIVISAVIGIISAIIGIFISIIFDFPPGPTMTLVATTFYFLAVLFSPSKGLIFSFHQNRLEKKRILREDILRQVIKNPLKIGMPIGVIAHNLNYQEKTISQASRFMAKSSLLSVSNDTVILSEEGINRAEQLVRAHRLWETYQVKQMGLKSDQIHDEADMLEHFLTEELLDEIDKTLGFPVSDPHDSPIPMKRK
jgi:ABC-type Mn2+/Zn2+ transport system permease subunit/Mn-dependent DtxR family transcriptional regulator